MPSAGHLSIATFAQWERVRQVALRASGLSTESLETIAEMIERVRTLEGLPDDPAESARGD